MPTLPTGTVTFLFTDIEGSTRLLQQLGDHYADTLAAYRRVRDNSRTPHWPVEKAHYRSSLAAARASLDRTIFKRVWAEGRGMTLEQAIEYGLSDS